MQPVQPTMNTVEYTLLKEQVLTALDTLNNHPFVAGAVKFVLDTSVDPWTVNVLDNDGSVLTSIPPKRIIEIVGTLDKLSPTGTAVDVEI